MAIGAIAYAGASFGRSDWVGAAVQSAEFLLSTLRQPGGRWLRSWCRGVRGPLAFAGDYAWLVDAFTRLFEATGEPRWLEVAQETAAAMVGLFHSSDGAFFTCGEDTSPLVARTADLYDGATPSANAVAIGALGRLADLTGSGDLALVAGSVLNSLAQRFDNTPAAFPAMACAAEALSHTRQQIVIAGDRKDMVACVHHHYLPGTVLAWGRPFASPIWEGRAGGEGGGLAYVCEGYRCLLPVSTVEELEALLS